MDIREIIAQRWPEWRVTATLGAGSFGSVYQVEREDIVGRQVAAVKVIAVPHDASEIASLRAEGLTLGQVADVLQNQVRSLGAEIRLMEQVKGYTNIVSIEDYHVAAFPQQLQWYVLFRMELLTPLQRLMGQKAFTQDEVIKLGIDMCQALIVCRKNNIVHRDIKPENIFVNRVGDYKLGDFGVARTMEQTTGGMTRTGTYNYMAPELFNNTLGAVDIDAAAKVDLYSLGMVLYVLTNNGRVPFVPTGAVPSAIDRNNALVARMRGQALPMPVGAGEALGRVILKACAFEPGDRFADAAQMLRALEGVRAGGNGVQGGPQPFSGVQAGSAPAGSERMSPRPDVATPPPAQPLRPPAQPASGPQDPLKTWRVDQVSSNPNAYAPQTPPPQQPRPAQTPPSQTPRPAQTPPPAAKPAKKGHPILKRALLSMLLAILIMLGRSLYEYVTGNDPLSAFQSSKPTIEPFEMPESVITTVAPVKGMTDTQSAETAAGITAGLRVGDTVTFGAFEQDGNTANGAEAITWRVVEVRSGAVMLLSDRILYAMAYDRAGTEVTWETSDVRAWLVNTFIPTAFSQDERALMKTWVIAKDENPVFTRVDAGRDALNSICIPSYSEVEAWFPNEADRKAYGTAYAVQCGLVPWKAESDLRGIWWLRTPGSDSKKAMYIDRIGETLEGGRDVTVVNGVRPVILVATE